jgi:hypothetical protein
VVSIFDDFFKQRKSYFSKKPADIDLKFKEALESVKKELDGHLEALNENTSEIQASYGCMNELNDKMEKLAERVEAIEIFMQQHSNFQAEEKSFEVQPLTKTEQHVFLVIYALEDEKGLVSCVDIRRKTGIPMEMVNEYIAILTEKGVPLMKKFINNIAYIRLNPEFKAIQAKENILCIDTAQKELINF